MTILHVDDQTAGALEAKAAACGVSVAEYLRRLAIAEATTTEAGKGLEDEVEELSFRGPTLPADFSRSDIYEGRVG